MGVVWCDRTACFVVGMRLGLYLVEILINGLGCGGILYDLLVPTASVISVRACVLGVGGWRQGDPVALCSSFGSGDYFSTCLTFWFSFFVLYFYLFNFLFFFQLSSVQFTLLYFFSSLQFTSFCFVLFIFYYITFQFLLISLLFLPLVIE